MQAGGWRFEPARLHWRLSPPAGARPAPPAHIAADQRHQQAHGGRRGRVGGLAAGRQPRRGRLGAPLAGRLAPWGRGTPEGSGGPFDKKLGHRYISGLPASGGRWVRSPRHAGQESRWPGNAVGNGWRASLAWFAPRRSIALSVQRAAGTRLDASSGMCSLTIWFLQKWHLLAL